MSKPVARHIVTLNEARELARRAGERAWKAYIPSDCRDCLSERYLEAENCWFFFRNPGIPVPEQNWLVRSSAYAVSKQGDIRSIADLSAEPEKLGDYLNLMSAYFAHREQGAPKPVIPDWIIKRRP